MEIAIANLLHGRDIARQRPGLEGLYQQLSSGGMDMAGLERQGQGAEEFLDAGGPANAEIFVLMGEDEAIAFGALDEDGGGSENVGFEDGAILPVALGGEVAIGEEAEGFADQGQAESKG